MLNEQSISLPHNEPQRSPGFVQKQPLELFCRKICFKKFHKFPRKTPVLESLFNSVAGRNFICERLLLFVSHQNNIANNSGKFELDETSTECKVNIFLKRTEAVGRRCSVKKGVLRNFTKFTRKHLCRSLFFNKVAVEHLWWLVLNVVILFNRMQPGLKKFLIYTW